MVRSESDIKQELHEVEGYVVQVTERLRRAEGVRDNLLRELADTTGAHSQRVVAVR